MKTSYYALLTGALAVIGCSGGGGRAGQAADSAAMTGHMDSGGMGMGMGMDSGGTGMGHMDSGGMGMSGMPMQGMPMMSGMRAHLDSMMRMPPQQMQAMMAMHQGMMSRMMDGMGADMRGMGMSGGPEWAALTDSVKVDLADLPNLKGQALAARMRSHAERVRRLMAMHETMMKR